MIAMSDLIRVSLRQVVRQRGFGVMLSIALGITAFIVLAVLGREIRYKVGQDMVLMGGVNVIQVYMDDSQYPGQPDREFYPDTVEALRHLPGVSLVSRNLRNNQVFTLRGTGERTLAVDFIGIDQYFADVYSIDLVAGRLLTQADVDSHRRVCMVKRKGYDVLLRACALLQARKIDFSLTLAGQGPEKLHLRWLVWRFGLRGKVRFAGQVPHENMADMYNRADIFVAPGRKTSGGEADGVPSSLVEALAFGLAVVASDLSGHAEALVDDQNGRLVPQDNPGALADVLEFLAARPVERKRLGEAARRSVPGLVDADHTEAKLTELIKKACGKA